MSLKKTTELLAIHVWLYDIFAHMQFERAVPWHRDSWVVWVLELRREIREILGSFLFFSTCAKWKVKPLPMQQLKCCHSLQMPIQTIFMIFCNPGGFNPFEDLFVQTYCAEGVWSESARVIATGLFMVPRLLADIEFLNFSICLLNLAAIIRRGACIVSCTVWRQRIYTPKGTNCCQLAIQEDSAFLTTDLPDSQSMLLWRIQVSMRESPPQKESNIVEK